MKDAERLLGFINEIRIKKQIGIFDAIILFCEDKKIDIEDIIPLFDSTLLEMIKSDAVNMGIVGNMKLIGSKKTTSLF